MKKLVSHRVKWICRALLLYIGATICLAQSAPPELKPHSEPDYANSNQCLKAYIRKDKQPLDALRKNAWIKQTASDTVFVLLHGILSDNVDAWLTPEPPCTYWPDLLESDKDYFPGISITLAGYYSKSDSASYSTKDAASAVWAQLTTTQGPVGLVATDYKNIVFVAHSLGGVIARRMLVSHANQLTDKNIGLLLVASPSNGSDYATILNWLQAYYPNALLKELMKDSTSLQALNDEFRQFQKNRPADVKLRVMELFETRFPKEECKLLGVFYCTWLSVKLPEIVPRDSAGNFDIPPIRVGDSDHLTIAKPQNDASETQTYARAFFQTFLARDAVSVFSPSLGNIAVTGVVPQGLWAKFGPKTDFVTAISNSLCKAPDKDGSATPKCNPWQYSYGEYSNPPQDGQVGFVLLDEDLHETTPGKYRFADFHFPVESNDQTFDGRGIYSQLIRTAVDALPGDSTGVSIKTSTIQPVRYSTRRAPYRSEVTKIPSELNTEISIQIPRNVLEAKLVETSVAGTISIYLNDLVPKKQLGVLRFVGKEENKDSLLLRFVVMPRKRTL